MLLPRSLESGEKGHMEGGIPLARMSSGPGLQTILDAPEAARVGSRWGRFQGAGLMVIRSAAVKNVKFILLKEACAVLDLVSCVIQAPSCERDSLPHDVTE